MQNTFKLAVGVCFCLQIISFKHSANGVST